MLHKLLGNASEIDVKELVEEFELILAEGEQTTMA
jgi:hypothetical protein